MSEQKHFYNNFNRLQTRSNFRLQDTTDTRAFKYGAPTISDQVLVYTPAFPSVGTGDNQRIGKEIYIKNIAFYGQLQNVITHTINQRLMTYLDADEKAETSKTNLMPVYAPTIPVRVMVVQFDDKIGDWQNMPPSTFKMWFNATYCPASAATSEPHYLEKRMRETTAYTGHFKILYDQVFRLGNELLNIDINLAMKQKFTFDSSNSTVPINNHIHLFVLTPWANNISRLNTRDDFNELFKNWMYSMDYFTTFELLDDIDLPVVQSDLTTKITYYDS